MSDDDASTGGRNADDAKRDDASAGRAEAGDVPDDDAGSGAVDAGGAAADATGSKAGTFLVTAVDGGGAVLRDVDDGQVHTLADAPDDLAVGEAVVGRVEPVPPMEVRWRLAAVEECFAVSVEESDEPPTAHERGLAAEEVGELVRRRRAGEGEIHVLTVPEDGTEAAVADVLSDGTGLRERAARLGVSRVVVRSEPGLVSVRYLP